MNESGSIFATLAPAASNVMRAVCLVFHVTPDVVLSKCKSRTVSEARRLFFVITYERSGMTKAQVNEMFGRPANGLDFYLRADKELRKIDEEYQERRRKVEALLNIDGFGDKVTTGVNL